MKKSVQFVEDPELGLLSVEEVAMHFGISILTAREAVASRQIPSVRIGKRDLIPRAALRRMLLNAGSE